MCMCIMKLILVFVVVIAALQCQARVMTVCELVHELRRLKFPESKLRDWVCLVDKESSFRTDVVGPANSDGSHDNGLFQINDRYWCNASNTPGKECNVTCAQLRTDDISVAASCAQKIFQIHGFSAWYGWVNGCNGKTLPDISHC